VWRDNSLDGSSYGVYAQRYNTDGTAAGSEFRVNTTTSNGQYEPEVAMLDGGDFVVVWRSDYQDGSAPGCMDSVMLPMARRSAPSSA